MHPEQVSALGTKSHIVSDALARPFGLPVDVFPRAMFLLLGLDIGFVRIIHQFWEGEFRRHV
jgi:hypothetical protein